VTYLPLSSRFKPTSGGAGVTAFESLFYTGACGLLCRWPIWTESHICDWYKKRL